MIISKLIGGLGNQMFQFSAGHALAAQHMQSLYLDISDFNGYELHHGFELERVFNSPINVATPLQCRALLGWRGRGVMKKVLGHPKLMALCSARIAVEPHFHYWPEFHHLSSDCYLNGYWQSEKYFKSIEPIIRKNFVFSQPISERNQKISSVIVQSHSVSLHVRRGDYVQNSNTFATHGVCSLDYYHAAIRYILERVDKPIFYVFSDDIAWVKDNLKIDSPCQYIDHNYGAESYNDMRLMSLCRHHIIANSSFSWWGAWLNPNSNKIVIAPRKWFNLKKDTRDLLPQSWIVL